MEHESSPDTVGRIQDKLNKRIHHRHMPRRLCHRQIDIPGQVRLDLHHLDVLPAIFAGVVPGDQSSGKPIGYQADGD